MPRKIREYVNRKAQKLYSKKWHAENREKHNKHIKEKSLETGVWFKEFKATLSCEKCKENHPACLEFHHKPGTVKKFNIGHMARRYTRKRILEEVKKCKILCANCHRKEHW